MPIIVREELSEIASIRNYYNWALSMFDLLTDVSDSELTSDESVAAYYVDVTSNVAFCTWRLFVPRLKLTFTRVI